MGTQDVLLVLIYGVPVAAFALIALLTLLVPALHVFLVLGRTITGQPADVHPWVLWRILPFFLTLGLVAVLATYGGTRPIEQQFAFSQLAILALVITGIMIPIALPVFQAYSESAHEWGLYVFALIAFLALPVAATVATGAMMAVTHRIAAQSPDAGKAFAALPPVFVIEETRSPCGRALTAALPTGQATAETRPGIDPQRPFSPPLYFFWVDMTTKAAFLDFFEAFECGTTNVRHNPENVLMSACVFVYRGFVQLIVLVALAYPFTRRRQQD